MLATLIAAPAPPPATRAAGSRAWWPRRPCGSGRPAPSTSGTAARRAGAARKNSRTSSRYTSAVKSTTWHSTVTAECSYTVGRTPMLVTEAKTRPNDGMCTPVTYTPWAGSSSFSTSMLMVGKPSSPPHPLADRDPPVHEVRRGRAAAGLVDVPPRHLAADPGRRDRLVPVHRPAATPATSKPSSPAHAPSAGRRRRRGRHRSGSWRRGRPRAPPAGRAGTRATKLARPTCAREAAVERHLDQRVDAAALDELRPLGRGSTAGAAPASGRSTFSGCGSKVSATDGTPSSRARATVPRGSAWWPRWTPSKLPMVTTPPRGRSELDARVAEDLHRAPQPATPAQDGARRPRRRRTRHAGSGPPGRRRTSR